MYIGIDVGMRNFAYCVMQGTRIVEWNCIDLLEQDDDWHNVTPTQMQDVLLRALPRLFDSLGPAHVGIEAQPFGFGKYRKFEQCKIWLASHLIYNYFRARMWRCTMLSVRFIQARLKYQAPWLKLAGMAQTPVNYAKRKQNSVRLCRVVAQHEAIDLRDKLETHQGKQDDLADAFLLCVIVRQSVPPECHCGPAIGDDDGEAADGKEGASRLVSDGAETEGGLPMGVETTFGLAGEAAAGKGVGEDEAGKGVGEAGKGVGDAGKGVGETGETLVREAGDMFGDGSWAEAGV